MENEEKKQTYLQMIQEPIGRMSTLSSIFKGFDATTGAAILALSKDDLNVFTLIIGLSFAIEIGQRISGTGTMDFGDILFGLSGFLLMFAIFAIAREVALALWNILKDIFGRG